MPLQRHPAEIRGLMRPAWAAGQTRREEPEGGGQRQSRSPCMRARARSTAPARITTQDWAG